ncbi:hypothetical protein TFLX_05349 [Thermoflexales bacterium]|nr:hypothetical protein TFLX_05349 [Thermoflexales bacterium]
MKRNVPHPIHDLATKITKKWDADKRRLRGFAGRVDLRSMMIGRFRMDTARELFDTLSSFRQVDLSGRTPSEQLFDYCTHVLSSLERVHVDFKEKRDRRVATLDEDDKVNLAKAISGFANSGGGVLIWGVEDKTLNPKPITNVSEFMKAMLGLAAQLTDPIVQGIDGDCISSGTGLEGFGFVYIPESSLPPHRVVLSHKDIKNHYYVRTGESFVTASHAQLEDMFGRRPQPRLSLSKEIVFYSMDGDYAKLLILLGIENLGRGTARSPFFSIKVEPPNKIFEFGIDGNGHFGLDKLIPAIQSNETSYGASASVVIHPETKRVATCVLTQIDMSINPLHTPDVVINYKLAAEGARLIEAQEIIKGVDLRIEVNQHGR